MTRRLIEEKDDIIARVASGARVKGISVIKSGRGQDLVGMISSLLGLFQSAAEQIQKERQAAVETKRFVVLRVIVGGTLLTLLLTGLGVIVVARSVTKPMSSLAQAALEIGESRYAVFPDADRQDEVGVLSRSMEEMQRRLVSAERLAALTRIATSIAHDLRTPLLGIEQGRLYRVLVNLLDNAVKNSPSGGNVRIIVSVRGEGSARRAVVAVEDEGKGLDPAALDTLFEPNRPVTSPTRMGTGLGLYLCRLGIA